MDSVFYFTTFILAAIGIYHIFEEVMWQIEKRLHADDINDMIDFIESKKKIK